MSHPQDRSLREQAAAIAREAAAIGERFDDADLFAIALHAEGHALVKASRVREGLALLDESMVVVRFATRVASTSRTSCRWSTARSWRSNSIVNIVMLGGKVHLVMALILTHGLADCGGKQEREG